MAESMDMEESGYLDSQHQDISILALRMSSRRKLGLYLNLEAAQPLPSGLLPDFNGLAECIGFEYLEICNFGRDKDPTNCLLNEWGNHLEMGPTLGNLVKYLIQMERFDVLEDCKDCFKRDAEQYLTKKKGELKPVQDQTVSQSPYNIDDMSVDETHIMTIQDVASGCPTYYDAFVCYNPEGEDLKFVKTMIEELENKRCGLKLFVPHRDDLPGSSKHVISAKLIQERCKRMVIVMSPRYLQSDACDFQTKFAHALSPGSRSKKLVPVLISQCETPNILRHVTMCDYTRGDLTGWFWERLFRSLQAPLNPHEITIENPNGLSDLEMRLVAQTQQLSLPQAGSGSQSRQKTLRPSASSSSLSKSSSSSSLSKPAATATAPQLSSSAARPGLGACVGASANGRSQTAPLAHQSSNDSGNSEGAETVMASGFQETSGGRARTGSGASEGSVKKTKRKMLSKLTTMFSSHSHHSSNC